MSHIRYIFYISGAELVPGWMIVSSETVTDKDGNRKEVNNWEVREMKDVEDDLKIFLTDLLLSFENRVKDCTKEMQHVLTCLDLDTLISLMCGEKLASGKVKLVCGEGPLELHGVEDFNKFYSFVCSLPHVKQLAEEEDAFLDSAFASTVFHQIKQALKSYLWRDASEHLLKWFSIPASSVAPLKKLQVVDPSTETSTSLGNTFQLALEGRKQPLKAKLNEAEVFRSIYTDETLFTSIGIEGCIAIDIALAKGGTEAVVESYYSVMKSQKKFGSQSNETLALR